MASQKSVQITNIPLPTSGLFVEARSGIVNGVYAAALENLMSTGVALRTVPGINWIGLHAPILRRIPFDAAGYSKYVEIRPDQAVCGNHKISRTFSASVSAAKISDNLLIFDGISRPVQYNGLAFSISEFETNAGVSAERLDGVVVHHDRVFAWDSRSTADVYYGDVGAITGELKRFPMSRLGNIKGSIVAMLSLTLDGANNVNDALAVFTSTGQIIIYEGLDPGDATGWSLSARVEAACPVSPRAFAQIGSDVWMLTPHGVVSVRQSISTSVMALVSDISIPIANLVRDWIEEGGYSWTMAVNDDGSCIVISGSNSTTLQARQLIYWTKSRSWSTASWPVRDLHNLGGRLEGTGLDGRLARFSRENPDQPVTARWESSWFSAGGPSRTVRFVKPTIRASAPLDVTIRVLSDFNDTPADIAEATQVVRIRPEEPGATVTLSDLIAQDVTGSVFQITMEVTAQWAEIVSLQAGIG
ncbi:hypothetical protein [Pseudogemmobacter sonorensis]|uniref:hypothetical protein n=1 Tax=Pseudogemmobacter sonorensis TaxID=2989681 RepID=UPI0036C47B63